MAAGPFIFPDLAKLNFFGATNLLGANTANFKLALVSSAWTPNNSTNEVWADASANEIAAGNGYTAGGEDTQNDGSESAGTLTVTGVDVVWTASGAVGPFRYVVLYNDTPAGDPLIGYWDYGSSISLASGETFTANFGASLFTVA